MGVNVVVSGGNINVGTGQAGSAAVSNSDDSYQATVAAGGSLELPDITITKNDDTTVTYPSVKDLDIGVIDPCVPSIPVGWDAMVAAYGIGYAYPQTTGQTTSYRTGDEKDIEDTIFAAARIANSLKPSQSLSDFDTLNYDNVYNNKNRWTSELGNQTFTNNLMIDHYTGLMWNLILQSNRVWNDAIDNALLSTHGGYSDWFLPSINQVASLRRSYNNVYSTAWSPLSINDTLWTSTTKGTASGAAFETTTTMEAIDNSKTNNEGHIFCRKHF